MTTRECEKCGKEYESYLGFIPDNIVDYSSWISMKEKYDWFCKECFNEEHPNHGIAFA